MEYRNKTPNNADNQSDLPEQALELGASDIPYRFVRVVPQMNGEDGGLIEEDVDERCQVCLYYEEEKFFNRNTKDCYAKDRMFRVCPNAAIDQV